MFRTITVDTQSTGTRFVRPRPVMPNTSSDPDCSDTCRNDSTNDCMVRSGV